MMGLKSPFLYKGIHAFCVSACMSRNGQVNHEGKWARENNSLLGRLQNDYQLFAEAEVNSLYTTFSDIEVNNCFSIYHTIPKLHFFLSLHRKMVGNSTLDAECCLWLLEGDQFLLFTSELANQRPRKAIFTSWLFQILKRK